MVLVILAAGMGSRYGGLKQLDVVGDNNESIIDFSLFDAIESGFKKVVFVVRKDFLEQIKEVFLPRLEGKLEVEFVCQELENIPDQFKNSGRIKPWGTAHALLMAKDVVNDNLCVINADDFYGKEAFLKIGNFLKITNPKSFDFSMVGYFIQNTLSENGTVSRGQCLVDVNGNLVDVSEKTDICKKEDIIVYQENDQEYEIKENTIVSMNFWGFTPLIFKEIEEQFYEFLKENSNEPKKEFYLPLVVNNLLESKKATVKVLESSASWMGVTYREDKDQVIVAVAKLKQEELYPKNLWS